ncbi:MAG: response regulator [Candidatus Cloacimonas sp.]|nr:response regulator [Candidatus Cloacimonadota bacterium]
MAKTIMVVDDEPHIRATINEYFTIMKYNVLEAGNGEEAFNIFNKNTVDLVITDIRMPIMNGIQLLRSIKMQSPDTPVILMTGYQPTRSQELSMTHKADGYLIKPFSLVHLKDLIVKHLN